MARRRALDGLGKGGDAGVGEEGWLLGCAYLGCDHLEEEEEEGEAE